ncbi:hypothetical protein E2C01_060162 [Portunus trituberculatus]|uniref:Uncharacterized protein n=1 Tax=Portunus trituberculatus TaxID=210409 RepID=A0A5B7H845_PORTR|nr:hypothetical protein [Portunus trituberculatus]
MTLKKIKGDNVPVYKHGTSTSQEANHIAKCEGIKPMMPNSTISTIMNLCKDTGVREGKMYDEAIHLGPCSALEDAK